VPETEKKKKRNKFFYPLSNKTLNSLRVLISTQRAMRYFAFNARQNILSLQKTRTRGRTEQLVHTRLPVRKDRNEHCKADKGSTITKSLYRLGQ